MSLTTAGGIADSIEIRPQPGPQTRFLSTPADIAIYGGAAGGGKTWGLLLEPLRHVHNPQFGAVVFRRTYPMVTQEGGLWDESEKLYPLLGAAGVRGDLYWRFPRGARVSFAHLQHESTRLNYQGAQIALICFDELTHFSESQFFYLLSRNRSTCGVRPYVRATCNPDPDSWVAHFIAWWIDQDEFLPNGAKNPRWGLPIPERAGAVRWFARVDERLEWADSRGALVARYPDLLPKSATFIPATVYDNQILLDANPEYLTNLMSQLPVDRAQLLDGNWKARASAGKVFDRGWFEIVDAVPAGGSICRFWDFAATERKLTGGDPDFTAGVRMHLVDGVYYVTDCIARQMGPAEADVIFKNTSQQDRLEATKIGARYLCRWEIEPGAAAIKENRRLVQMLAGIDAGGVRPQGDKIQRAKALASQAQVGNVKLLRGAWNEGWLRHMHGQPDLSHDDILDGSSGAFNALTEGVAARPARSRQG